MKPTFAYPARRPYTFNLLATAVIALILGGCATTSNLPYRQRGGYPLVSGHRGANCIAPENTMASLDRTNFTFGRDEDMIAFRKEFPIVCRIGMLDRKFVRKCHRKGLQVLALCLGTDDMSEANRKAVQLNVDVVATDRPVAFRRQFAYRAKGL